jgi:hypothetical protein
MVQPSLVLLVILLLPVFPLLSFLENLLWLGPAGTACPTNAKVPSATGVSNASGFPSVADLTSLLLRADLCDLVGVFAIVGILPVAGVPAIATVSAAANRGSVADDSDNHPCSCCRTKKSNMLDFQTMGYDNQTDNFFLLSDYQTINNQS